MNLTDREHEARRGAVARRVKAEQIIVAELRAMGHRIVVRDSYTEVDGGKPYEISLDRSRWTKGGYVTRARIKLYGGAVGSTVTQQYPEPDKGWDDGRLRHIAREVHEIMEIRARQAELHEQQARRREGLQRIAEAINARNGVVSGQPGSVSVMGDCELIVTRLRDLNEPEAEVVSLLYKQLAEIRRMGARHGASRQEAGR